MATTDINGAPVLILNERETALVKMLLNTLYRPQQPGPTGQRILKKIADVEQTRANIESLRIVDCGPINERDDPERYM